MSRNLIGAAVLFALAACCLFGQALSGTIVGTVTDQAGAVVPGAKVTLVNEGTQFTRTETANANGQYVAYSFPTGRVTVSIEQPGFQKLVRSGVELTAADTITVNLQLSVGNVQQTVEVTGEAPMLQAQTAAVSTLVSNQQVVEMPLSERNFIKLIQLGAGVAPSTPGMPSDLTAYNMRGNDNASVNGSVTNNNAFLIDGMYNRSVFTSGIIFSPPVDSIQEARVMGSNYSSQYGSAAGAVMLIQTKSGTNQYHGSMYEFLRNSVTDANTFFNNRQGAPTPAYRHNEFGATLGGPIRKDKTFLFVDYQGLRIIQPTTTVDTIPTQALKQMVQTGNFGGLGTVVYNPYSVTTNSNGTLVRQPFQGNQIPAQLLDPAAVNLMNLLITPNAPGSTRNYVFSPEGSQRDDQFDVRIDQNVGTTDRFFARFTYDNAYGQSPGALPTAPGATSIQGPYLATGAYSPTANWAVNTSFTKVFSASIVDEIHLAVLRNYLANYNSDQGYRTAASLGIPNINTTNDNFGIPYIQISGFQSFGSAGSYPELTGVVALPIDNVTTVVKGSHTIKFGGNWMRQRMDLLTTAFPRGSYNFNGAFTRQIGTTSSATALADLALGMSNTTQRSTMFGTFGMRYWYAGLFAEDSWRATSRLTVTYGARYELESPGNEAHNRISNLNVVTGVQYTPTNGNGCGASLVCLDYTGLGPRVGIAYMLTKDQKTVLRSGFGEAFFEAVNGGKVLTQNPPMNIVQGYSFDQTSVPFLLFSQGVPPPVQPNLSDPTQLTGIYTAFNPHMKLNASLQWSIGIQRELLPSLLLDVAYVGSRTNHLTNGVDANQALPGPGGFQPRRPLYSVNPVIQDINYRTDWSAAKYHSLQVNVQKRYTRGLTASLAWTWSHNMAQSQGPNTTSLPQNDLCYACEWGDQIQDRRHMVVINHVYELPFGKGRQFINSGLLAQIVGNWSISSIWTMYSGAHFGPALSTSVSNAIGVVALAPVERPNLNGTPYLPTDQRSINEWFNVPAFSTPAAFTFGNAGKGILEGPGYFNVDTVVHRDFQVRERWRLSFRWEMFNALNHANFNNPNATIGSSSAGQMAARCRPGSCK